MRLYSRCLVVTRACEGMKADAWDNALFDGREDLYENGKEALVDGGYRHCAAQTCYSAVGSPSQLERHRYISATESRWRMGICNSMVARAKYPGVQNCTIITPSPLPLFSATLSSLPSHSLALAVNKDSRCLHTLHTSYCTPGADTSYSAQTSYLTLDDASLQAR